MFVLSCDDKNDKSSNSNNNTDVENTKIPTREKVEYVFACMQGNDDTQAYMDKCSCSIDYIAERMSYEDYVQAQTVMSLRQIDGEKSIMFRHTPNAMEIYDGIQDLIAEAEMECF
tara:strand:- start:315 stop:659 length:345 start_codon:yes stop_codon:yes gene_type:complete